MSRRIRWTNYEDQSLINYYNENDDKDFVHISKIIPDRTTKQARERWRKFLDPNLINDQKLAKDQLETLKKLVGQYGKAWKYLKKYFPGFSEVKLKNSYNSLEKKESCNKVQDDEIFFKEITKKYIDSGK
jgi:hypothetical protein